MPYVLRKLIVADHKVECVGLAPQSCLLTKPAEQTDSQSDWEYRYSDIEDFDYLPNYEYNLLLRIRQSAIRLLIHHQFTVNR